MQMSFPHTCIVSHFSSSSRVRETNTALPTRPVPRLSMQQEEAAYPTQPLSCVRLMSSYAQTPSPKRTIRVHLTQPRKPTEPALLPPQIWSLTLHFPRASDGKGWKLLPLLWTSLSETLHLKKRSVGKRVNLHVTQERRCCHRAVHGSVGGDPTLKDFHVVREHPAFLSPLIPIPLSGIWLKPHVFVLW